MAIIKTTLLTEQQNLLIYSYGVQCKDRAIERWFGQSVNRWQTIVAIINNF